jgi:uncharacterized Zn-binding protein involved in type VI secretion
MRNTLRILALALVLGALAAALAMGAPASRVGDMHTCPLFEPPGIPHVGGPILLGDPTVLICGHPAARLGDPAQCVGPVDSIAGGSGSVLIGGLPAARQGDPSAHGGVVVAGCPTVLIGP